MNQNLVFRMILVVIALLAAWRILMLGLSEYYVNLALNGDKAAVEKALAWNARQPKALYLRAKQVKDDNPAQAISLLQHSIKYNPTDSRAVVELASLLLDGGEEARGDELAVQAVRLMPSYVPVRLKVAEYWFKREQWDKVLENLQMALVIQPELGKKVFPVLLQIGSSSESRPILLGLTQEPPAWWEDFFSYVVKHADSMETVIGLATMRNASTFDFSSSEREDLVWRLIQDKMWPEAYLVWANGLSSNQRNYLGSVYNGGFELEIDNKGFDWHISTPKGIVIQQQDYQGAVGDKALHLRFENEEMRFRHLSQPLFLQKGRHEILLKTKIEFLRGRGGLIWTVHCAGKGNELLGLSEKLLGMMNWQTVRFEIDVPESEDCLGQTLRLESTGKHTYDHKLEGDIWFDQVIIRSIR